MKKKDNKKIINKKAIKKSIIRFLCIILCFALLLPIFSPVVTAKSFLRNSKIIADKDTTDDYIDHMINDKNGSRYAGRIWTDKSVLTGEVNLDMETDGYEGTITNNSDFLHVFSALGSSQAWIGLPPARTIIVIDNSASMYGNSKEWDKTRIKHTIEATNKAIDSLMRASQYNEIAVVLFGDGQSSWYNGGPADTTSASTAKVIVPMGHYPISNNSDEPYQYLQSGWNVSQASPESDPEIPNIPVTPLTDPKAPNVVLNKGTVYVDKMYVNDKFIVDSSYEGKVGKERYNLYTNGTTNIQAGFHVAYEELLKGQKEVNVGGYTFGYLPNIVMLTDGAATDMLKGTYSNPILEERGFTNDRGTKLASYVEVFHESTVKNTADWNMIMSIVDKNGVETFEQVGYGDGTLSEGLTVGTFNDTNIEKWSTNAPNMNPGAEGLKGMQKFAEEVRSTQGTMLLTTLMMVAYEKAVIAKAYGSECDIYTISVDIDNPASFDLDPNDELAPELKNLSSSSATMNPNKYFNLKWLQEAGFIKAGTDLDNVTENDLAYRPYTAGSEIIMSIDAAIKAWNEFKSGSDSTEARDNLKYYVAYNSAPGLYGQMKNGKVIYNDKEYPVTKPIGPDHNDGYQVYDIYEDITYDHLQKDDKENNPYGITDEDLDINYVTKAFYPKSVNEAKDSIASAFDEIVQNIKEPAFVPTHDSFSIVDNLIYSDPIGKYMEVKDVKNLLLFGELYEISKTDLKYVTKNGEDETESSAKTSNYNYTRQYYKVVNNGEDELINNCYKIIDESEEFDSVVTYNLSDIKIYVDTNLNAGPLENDQTLYVEIPSTALPLQVVTIKLNKDGTSAYYHTNINEKKNSTPLRILYEVGITEDILMNNKKDIDLTKISDEYKAKYINKNDELSLYSNYYSNTLYDGYIADTQEDARTKGDAVLSISPNITNRYYIFQKNLKLYDYAYIIEKDGNVHEENNPLLFEGADFDGEFDGQTENDQPNSEAQAAIREAYNEGKLKEGDIIVLKGDTVKYGTNPKSEDFYYFPIDFYLPTSDNHGEMVKFVVARRGSEFGSGILQEEGNIIPKGDFLSWIDETGNNLEVYDYSAKIPEEKQKSGRWILATKIGGLRIGDLHQGVLRKENNVTGTSRSYYLPAITHAISDQGSDVILSGFLGNNGLITYKIEKWTIPAAGGIGTLIFTIIGLILIIVSSMLIKNRRIKKHT